MSFFKTRLSRQFIFITILMFVIGTTLNTNVIAESKLIPISIETVPVLIEKIIQNKLIPYQIDKNGLKLAINKLVRYSMDLENSQFLIECGFNVQYKQAFINLNQSGSVVLNGSGLLSPAEQKLGAKLVEIKEIHLDNFSDSINSTVRYLLDKSLAGKEFWYGEPPKSNIVLNRENFSELIRIAVSQQLPISKTVDQSELTLIKLSEFNFLEKPGEIKVTFGVKGKYHKLISVPFEGDVSLVSQVFIDPDKLIGLCKFDRLIALKLNNCPNIGEQIIKSLINSKIKGEQFEISWQ